MVPAPPRAGATETLPKPSKPLISSPPVLRPQVEEDEQPGAHLHHLLQPSTLQLCSSPASAESGCAMVLAEAQSWQVTSVATCCKALPQS